MKRERERYRYRYRYRYIEYRYRYVQLYRHVLRAWVEKCEVDRGGPCVEGGDHAPFLQAVVHRTELNGA